MKPTWDRDLKVVRVPKLGLLQDQVREAKLVPLQGDLELAPVGLRGLEQDHDPVLALERENRHVRDADGNVKGDLRQLILI